MGNGGDGEPGTERAGYARMRSGLDDGLMNGFLVGCHLGGGGAVIAGNEVVRCGCVFGFGFDIVLLGLLVDGVGFSFSFRG